MGGAGEGRASLASTGAFPLSHKRVMEILSKAKPKDTVRVDWSHEGERGVWCGVLGRKGRSSWSIVYDISEDSELETFIPRDGVNYLAVEIVPPDPCQEKLKEGEGGLKPKSQSVAAGPAPALPPTAPSPISIEACAPLLGHVLTETRNVPEASKVHLPGVNVLVDRSAPSPIGADEFEDLLEITHGDLLSSNVTVNFPSRHAHVPRVTELKGDFLSGLSFVPHDPKMLPHRALAKSTVLAHKRILRQLMSMPQDLKSMDLGDALVNHFIRQRQLKRLRWSTLLTKMATAHGALRLLPLYTTTTHSVMMKESIVWMQSMKAVSKEAKQEVPVQATPATWEKVLEAIRKASKVEVRVALLMTWLTCGRGGDVLQLQPDCVEVQETGLMVHFRRGKTVKTRGAYPIFTPLPPQELKEEVLAYLKAAITSKQRWLFPGVKGKDIKEALRKADPRLEQRSLRRGAIQELARSNLSDEELLKYSGHTNVQMLRRYLNFGKLSGEGRQLQSQAAVLLQSSQAGRK